MLRESIELILKEKKIKTNVSGLMAIFPHHLVSALLGALFVLCLLQIKFWR